MSKTDPDCCIGIAMHTKDCTRFEEPSSLGDFHEERVRAYKEERLSKSPAKVTVELTEGVTRDDFIHFLTVATGNYKHPTLKGVRDAEETGKKLVALFVYPQLTPPMAEPKERYTVIRNANDVIFELWDKGWVCPGVSKAHKWADICEGAKVIYSPHKVGGDK